MSEHESIEQLENYYRYSLGMLLLKPDGAYMGVAEELIDYSRIRMEQEASARLTGVFLIEAINREDLSYMYPDVPRPNLDLSMDIFSMNACSTVLVFEGMRSDIDLWKKTNEIRGKTMRHQTKTGLRDSIRSIIPLPGFPNGDYRVMTERWMGRGKMSLEDEPIMHYNLAHAPDNLREIAGILRLIPQSELIEAFGEIKVAELNANIMPHLTLGK